VLSEILSFRTPSIVLALKKKTYGKHDVSETGSVSVLRCGKKPILLGPLERASLNHWIIRPVIEAQQNRFFPHLRRKHPVSETSCFPLFVFNTRTMDRVRNPNISESYTPSSESYSNYCEYQRFAGTHCLHLQD
jgi:hypothetical protein